ncbi:MAG: hypothetical protein LUO87_01600 [Methanomicrobiales archaeon]|nr:hypothetical protein [Methanomicrobiales archaeon]MDD1660694.1 hypothetical protein [Methanomicrobiales archaeon]
MEEIRSADGELIAVVVRADYRPDGVRFLSAPGDALQLGVSGYRRGVSVAPHAHRNHEVLVPTGQEMIHVDQGKVAVDIYDRKDRFLARTLLSSGDTILFLSGGHGLSMEEDTRIIEVKQGPYGGREEDKRPLRGREKGPGEGR